MAAILAVIACYGSVGLDANVYWNALQSVSRGGNPYADGIAAQSAYHARPHADGNWAGHGPLNYIYPPLTLALLKILAWLPGWLLGSLCACAMAAGFLLQLWGGLQLADKDERRWLVPLLPLVAFFPGLIIDRTIVSGNLAFILYGLILAASVPGWKRGRWLWFYVAVLLTSIFKTPALTLLAFPILVGRRQWLPAGLTATAGIIIFNVQRWLWPELFRSYLAAVRIRFDWEHDFGYSPAGTIGNALWHWKLVPHIELAILIWYLAFSTVIAIVLLVYAWRAGRGEVSREKWLPLAMFGSFLLNPRLMKYDLIAITIPMLLISGRALRLWVSESAPPSTRITRTRAAILAATSAVLLVNACKLSGLWMPLEVILLGTTFVLGIWSLQKQGSTDSRQENAQPARPACEAAATTHDC
jgi:glycosyl transferase family 87